MPKYKKMIDLEKLEKEIDELLENQTSESLTTWLNNHRLKQQLWNLLGEGTIGDVGYSFNISWVPNEYKLPPSSFRSQVNIGNKSLDCSLHTNSENTDIAEDNNYAIAA